MTYAIHTCPKCGWQAYCDGEVPTHVCHKQERERPVMETVSTPIGTAQEASQLGAIAVKQHTANNRQHGGNHYASPMQCWDYLIANNIGYLDGTAIKYLTRWRKKGGIEDLRKAIHFIEKLIEVETQRQ